MAVLKLPRMPDGAAIVDTKNGKPITALTRAWNSAMTQIESSVTDIQAAIDAATGAQADADAAMAAAIAAQADADAALAAAVAAQATADAAKATADALDAALNVTAGKVLTVLNTMTLAAIDGSTLNIGAGGTLGTAAFTNASDYLPSGSSGSFLAKASNLSDVASVATARTNLGLGTSATQNTGTSGATVPLLNGANTWAGAQIFSSTVNVAGHTTFEGVTSTGATGTGRLVYDGSPTLITPNIGAATGTSLLLNGSFSTEKLSTVQSNAGSLTAAFLNTNAAPGSALQVRIVFLNAAPNNSSSYFLFGDDSIQSRFYFMTNGGLANVQSNDIAISDETVKGAVQRYSEPDLDALERSFLKVNWGRFKYLDQTHDDWNHGYTAQGVEEAFALTAPELVDETELGPKDGAKRKGVYDSDLTHIGLALLARGLKRIEAMEGKMYAAGIT